MAVIPHINADDVISYKILNSFKKMRNKSLFMKAVSLISEVDKKIA